MIGPVIGMASAVVPVRNCACYNGGAHTSMRWRCMIGQIDATTSRTVSGYPVHYTHQLPCVMLINSKLLVSRGEDGRQSLLEAHFAYVGGCTLLLCPTCEQLRPHLYSTAAISVVLWCSWADSSAERCCSACSWPRCTAPSFTRSSTWVMMTRSEGVRVRK